MSLILLLAEVPGYSCYYFTSTFRNVYIIVITVVLVVVFVVVVVVVFVFLFQNPLINQCC